VTAPPRVLIADATPATHATLEPLLRRAGWSVFGVTSSVEVLRAVRDHEVGIVLIDPELPGAGVSGVDVVRTLRSATRYRELPVLFLLHDGQKVPADAPPAEGALALDRLSEETLLGTILAALEVRQAAPAIVREIALRVVPEVAERLIREEIERLRAEHGLEGSA
jgi:CheY-like chemotaxis protein